jgi:hypothetical protein
VPAPSDGVVPQLRVPRTRRRSRDPRIRSRPGGRADVRCPRTGVDGSSLLPQRPLAGARRRYREQDILVVPKLTNPRRPIAAAHHDVAVNENSSPASAQSPSPGS